MNPLSKALEKIKAQTPQNIKDYIETLESSEQLKKYIEINFFPYNEGDMNPYHNSRHMLGVTNLAHELCRLNVRNHNKVYTEEFLKILTLAGMFHDFNHTGGIHNDDTNIKRAIDSINLYRKELIETGLVTDFIIDSAIAAIRNTRFPYLESPRTELMEILRDADVLWANYTNDIRVLIHDLRYEIQLGMKRLIPMSEFYEMQVNFMNNVEIFSESGKTLFENTKQDTLLELKRLSNPNRKEIEQDLYQIWDLMLELSFESKESYFTLVNERVLDLLKEKIPNLINVEFTTTFPDHDGEYELTLELKFDKKFNKYQNKHPNSLLSHEELIEIKNWLLKEKEQLGG